MHHLVGYLRWGVLRRRWWEINARMSADPAKANQNGAVTPHTEASSPPIADPITMPPTTPVR
jgi:hypothetical protein